MNDNSLRSKNASYSSAEKDFVCVQNFLDDPICTGYILKFSTSEFNAENMEYIIACVEYTDLFLHDLGSWKSNWKIIDEELACKEGEDIPFQWPSCIVSLDKVQKKIDDIYSTFISSDAPSEVCLSTGVLNRTAERVKRVDLYGPHVFGESIREPVTTVKRDIIPRFLKSNLYGEMVARKTSLINTPPAESLTVPLPTLNIHDKYTKEELANNPSFSLTEVLSCGLLYERFLQYCVSVVSSENVLCFQMITHFEGLLPSDENYKDMAWDIYRYFVIEGAALEVSVESSVRKEICINLPSPHSKIFDAVKQSAYACIETAFNSFRLTPEYVSLGDYCLLRTEQPKSRFNFFGFGLKK
mmetsp:Transcript_16614/g.25006  ORF Transcript_16614/g.25006 Transcript_16614/m.25006 type:complete len:356 (-) Transcript_16614:529-1596(-)